MFWYGDRPTEQLKRLVGAKLVEVEDMGGSWENGLTYEARTLLFKALNNLIERSLVKKVRFISRVSPIVNRILTVLQNFLIDLAPTLCSVRFNLDKLN